MRLALNAVVLRAHGMDGVNRYTGAMVRALLRLEPTALAYVADPDLDLGERARAAPALLARPGFAGNLARLLWTSLVLPRRLRRDGATVAWTGLPEAMRWPPCPQVVTVHDLLALRYPSVFPRQRWLFRVVVPRLLRHAAAIVCVSAATRDDVLRHYGDLGPPLHVVHQGIRDDVFRPRPGSGVRARHGLERYALAVGEARPYKNLRGLLDAFARVATPGLTLAVAGVVGRNDPSLPDHARALGLGERVRFLGFVPDEDLAALYTDAELFVFPSLWEGFGLPPVEAQACGCPVVASSAGAIPEACGDGARFVDAADSAALARAIDEVAGDPALRDDLRARGLANAARFDRERSAREVLAICRAVEAGRA